MNPIGIKVVLYGEQEVGKSSLCQALSDTSVTMQHPAPYQNTIGVDFRTLVMDLSKDLRHFIVRHEMFGATHSKATKVTSKKRTVFGKTTLSEYRRMDANGTGQASSAKLLFWDTAGDARFASIVTSYARGSNVLLFCYDISNRKSFDSIQETVEKYVPLVSPESVLILVGCKADLSTKRQVEMDEANDLAKKLNMGYVVETSASDPTSCQTLNEIIVQAHVRASFESMERRHCGNRWSSTGSVPVQMPANYKPSWLESLRAKFCWVQRV